VRSLAGRSASAAKEIKALIGGSAQRIANGNAQVDVAGDTMGSVVKSIAGLQQLMGDISAAAVAQSAGIQQVHSALSLMDEGTQQNAALVEEMAAATEGLRHQSDELVESVLQFKLSDAARA
jgi:methyl-accepting chemotaxis protein